MQQLFSGQLIKKLLLYLGNFFNAVDNDVFVGGMHAFAGSRVHDDNRTALGESSGIRGAADLFKLDFPAEYMLGKTFIILNVGIVFIHDDRHAGRSD